MTVPVKRLSGADRPALAAHFIRLGDEDRRLRFGIARSDDPLRYVDSLDSDRCGLSGYSTTSLALAGVAHVAVSRTPRSCAMVPAARNRGIGTALFERANLFARTHYIRTMFTIA